MDTNPSLYQAVRMVRKSLAMQGIRIPRIGRVLVLLSFGEGYSQAVLGLVDLLLMGGTPDPSICSSARAENLQVNWKQSFRLGTPPTHHVCSTLKRGRAAIIFCHQNVGMLVLLR